MIKAFLRTAAFVVVILVAVRVVPELAPYQTTALVLAVVTGLFGFVARSLVLLLLVASAVGAYFLFF